MFTVVVDAPGTARAVELTPIASSVQFDSAAVGGFGSASFTLDGDQRRKVPPLATVRVMYGTAIAWEGRLEDPEITIDERGITTTVSAFGWQRLLSDVSVRRVWSLRSIDWNTPITAQGVDSDADSLSFVGNMQAQSGQFDPADLTKIGVRISGIEGSVSGGIKAWGGVEAYALAGLTFTRILATYLATQTDVNAVIQISSDGSSYTLLTDTAGSFTATSYDSGVISAAYVRLGARNHHVADNPQAGDYVDFYDIRLLGTALLEDTPGGFYGDTLLRDLIALCPGLTQGLIEVGSDFAIPELERRVRSLTDAVVQEIASYYSREWAVWESGRFDWRTPALEEAQWVAPLAQLSRLNIKASVDNLAATVYVLYTNAVDQATAESTAASTDRRNAFVKTGQTKDLLVNAPASMTANTAGQLATLNAGEQTYVPVTGSITVPATALLANAVGTRQPAALIRAGQNIVIPDLPKTEPLRQGRDGETLFHIVSSSVDMGADLVTLQLEGQSSRMSVINARLAAATRVLTG